MGGGASKVSSATTIAVGASNWQKKASSGGGGAYLKTEVFRDAADDLQREGREVRKQLEEMKLELFNKVEDLTHSQEELEDLTAASFARVKEQLQRSERETKGLRSEVSHATACVGKMGGAVKKQRTGATTSEARIAGAEQAVSEFKTKLEDVEARLKMQGEEKAEVETKLVKTQEELLALQLTTAKHTMTLGKQYEDITAFKNEKSDDKFGAQYSGFGTSANRTFAQIDALFDALAERMSNAEQRADDAEVRAEEERLKRIEVSN